MPIIVDPSIAPPAPAAVAISADRKLVGFVDPEWAGILLRCNFAEQIFKRNRIVDPATTATTKWTGTAATLSTVSGKLKMQSSGAVSVVIPTPDAADATSTKFTVMSSEKIAARVRVTGHSSKTMYVKLELVGWNSGTVGAVQATSGYVACPPNVDTILEAIGTVAASGVNSVMPTVTMAANGSGGAPASGDFVYTTHWFFNSGKNAVTVSPVPYFTGATTPTSDGLSYRWIGTADASITEAYVPATLIGGNVPDHVTFQRADGTPVRGGDDRWCPDGYGLAYDHESDLDTITTWYAVPSFQGVPGASTGGVSLATASPETGIEDPSTWIKSIDDPSLSMQLPIDTWSDISYNTAADLVRATGRKNPVGSFDVMSGANTAPKFLTRGSDESKRLLELLSSGILLIQVADRFDRPAFYAVVSQASRSTISRMEYQYTSWSLTLTEVDRPPTAGQPARIPGHSLNDRLANYPTLTDVPHISYMEQSGPVL